VIYAGEGNRKSFEKASSSLEEGISVVCLRSRESGGGYSVRRANITRFQGGGGLGGAGGKNKKEPNPQKTTSHKKRPPPTTTGDTPKTKQGLLNSMRVG